MIPYYDLIESMSFFYGQPFTEEDPKKFVKQNAKQLPEELVEAFAKGKPSRIDEAFLAGFVWGNGVKTASGRLPMPGLLWRVINVKGSVTQITKIPSAPTSQETISGISKALPYHSAMFQLLSRASNDDDVMGDGNEIVVCCIGDKHHYRIMKDADVKKLA